MKNIVKELKSVEKDYRIKQILFILFTLPIIYISLFLWPWSPVVLKRNIDQAHNEIVILQNYSNFLEKRIKTLEERVK